MPRRTPLEVAIAQQTEKQGRYEAKLRAQGMTKVCLWVPIAHVDGFRTMAAMARDKHLAKDQAQEQAE